MRFLSVCSGIEAASVAWSPLGWKAWAFAEIEPFPSAVLAHRYPSTPNLGDMTGFKDWPDATLDVLCGGTPCQSFSNAGLRAGLDDPRGQLMLTFGAIAARYRPRWLVWENVPGVLSSNGGRDFGAFLGLLGFLGYGFAYRVLDAQFVRVDGHGRAVPQRRNRVFVVGCLGDWRSAAAVLLERESLRGDPAPRRSAGARVAGALAASLGGGRTGGPRGADDNAAQAHHLVAGALAGNGPGAGWRIGPDEAAANQLVAYGGNNTSGPRDVASALSAHGGTGRMDFESETFIAHAPSVHGTMTARSSRGGGQTNSPGHNADEALVVHAPLAFDTTQVTSALNRNNPRTGDPCHPLAAGAHAPAIAFQAKQSSTSQGPSYDDISPCLDVAKAGGLSMQQGTLVRRLMPVECERLMGFPDGYTAIPWRGRPASECPDGPRYKALGNSWATNCARWVGRRIALADSIGKAAAA